MPNCSIHILSADGVLSYIRLLWGPAKGQICDSKPSELPHEHLSWVNNPLSLFALLAELLLHEIENMQNIKITFNLQTLIFLTCSCFELDLQDALSSIILFEMPQKVEKTDIVAIELFKFQK